MKVEPVSEAQRKRSSTAVHGAEPSPPPENLGHWLDSCPTYPRGHSCKILFFSSLFKIFISLENNYDRGCVYQSMKLIYFTAFYLISNKCFSTSEKLENGGIMCLLHQIPQNYIFKIKDPHYFIGTNALPHFCIVLETLFQLYLILTDSGQVSSLIWASIFSFTNSWRDEGAGIDYMRDTFLCWHDGSWITCPVLTSWRALLLKPFKINKKI